jgi:hypothetical protein
VGRFVHTGMKGTVKPECSRRDSLRFLLIWLAEPKRAEQVKAGGPG